MRVLLVVCALTAACGPEQPAVQWTGADVLLESQQMKTLDRDGVITTSFGVDARSARFGIRQFRLWYRTQSEDGAAITATGSVLVPLGATRARLVIYNHGTIFPASEFTAPSYAAGVGDDSLIRLIAARGFVVAAPDYIGYGATRDRPHSYLHNRSSARTAVDVARAAREFAQRQSITLEDGAFVTGYSQGGAVAMATAQLLQQEATPSLTVRMLVAGAGPYHVSRFAREIVNSTAIIPYLNTYAWALVSYHRVYAWPGPLEDYVQPPYAAALQRDIGSAIPLVPSLLLTERFRQSLFDTPAVQRAFADNDTHNWRPNMRVVLMHGDRDDFVPPYHSADALDAMRSLGAERVEVRWLANENHFSAIGPFLQQSLELFEQAP